MNTEDKNAGLTPREQRKPFKTLRTYQGDVDEILSKGKTSTTTILVAEQKRKEESGPRGFEPDNKLRNKSFITLSGVLLLVGIAIVPVVYYIKSINEIEIIKQKRSLISFSEEKTISIVGLSREKFAEIITLEKNSFKSNPNSVLYLNIVNGNSPEVISKVLPLFSGRIPSSLSRSFGSNYMVGIYSFDTNEPFIILTTNDFAESYAGMLKWEKDINKDLAGIFAFPLNTGTTSVNFIDEEFHNKDLRVLKDENNRTILLYSFIDKNTLVITNKDKILSAIIGKYLINNQNN